MALFNLTDIEIKPFSRTGVYDSQSRVSGTNNDEKYNLNQHRYPSDLGQMDKGHYMMIFINEQVHTQVNLVDAMLDDPTVIANAKEYGIRKLNQAIGDTLTPIVNAGANLVSTIASSEKVAEAVKITKDAFKRITDTVGVRTIRRTAETIALYMPDSLVFSQQQGYSDLELVGDLTKLASGTASVVDGMKRGIDTTESLKNGAVNLSPFLASMLPGKLGQAAFAVGFGLVNNPMLELLYSAPVLREFNFDFMFYPRSEKEGKEVQQILKTLKFHQAPEIRKDSYSNFLIPPSEFDIKFYYNGYENPNIPEISTCILTSIDVNYAPNGFSTYEVPRDFKPKSGGTGMPVAIGLSLKFRETEFMTKDHYTDKKEKGIDFYGVY